MLALLVLGFLADTSLSSKPPIALPSERWQVVSGVAVHSPTQIGFPLVIDDFHLLECQDGKESALSAGVVYGSNRKGGVRIAVLTKHRTTFEKPQADEAAKELIAQKAIDIAKNRGEASTLAGGIAFDVTLAGKKVSAYTTLEPPDDPKSDMNCLWLSLGYGDHIVFSGTKFHGKELTMTQAAKIIADLLPLLNWPALKSGDVKP